MVGDNEKEDADEEAESLLVTGKSLVTTIFSNLFEIVFLVGASTTNYDKCGGQVVKGQVDQLGEIEVMYV